MEPKSGLSSNIDQWFRKATKLGVAGTNIHDFRGAEAPSKIPDTQYYCLRVLWERPNIDAIYDFLTLANREVGREAMNSDEQYAKYLKAITLSCNRSNIHKNMEGGHDSMGMYGLLYHMQNSITHPDSDGSDKDSEDDGESSENETLDEKDPMSRANQKIILVAKEHAKAKPGLKDLQYLDQSSPLDRKGGHSQSSNADLGKLIGPMSSLNVQETPAKQINFQYSANVHYTHIVGSKLQHPALPQRVRGSQDEVIVESAFHTLLYLLLVYHKDKFNLKDGRRIPEWSREHMRMEFGDRWVAITDGCLKAASGRKKAIVEVKPFTRRTARNKIRKQESGQMATGIRSDPSEGTKLPDGNKW